MLAAFAAALLLAPAALAKGSRFVLLDGRATGSIIKTDGGPKVPGKRNHGALEGNLVPQAGGNQFNFQGRALGRRADASARGGLRIEGDAAPFEVLPPFFTDLALSILCEERFLYGTFAPSSDAQLRTSRGDTVLDCIDLLKRWDKAVSAAGLDPSLTGRLHQAFLDASAKDKKAKKKIEKSKFKPALKLLLEALQIKRGAAQTIVDELAPRVLIPGETREATALRIRDLGAGSTDAVDGSQITGILEEGPVPTGVLYDNEGNLIRELPPATPGLPSSATAIGPDGAPGGNEGEPPSGCGVWDGMGTMWALGDICGISDGSDDGFAGFYRDAAGRERAMWLKPSSGSNRRRAVPGYRRVAIGKFPAGGASLFTINNEGLAWGDHFLAGETGPFRAFRADLKSGKTTELYRPKDGSTQPIASNDVGLAGGAARLADGSLEAELFWGSKHYTRFADQGGAVVRGMNQAGVAVGSIGANTASPRAALFVGGAAFDLNTLNISGLEGWTLTRATDINDSGQIVGNGLLSGVEHGFLLTPES